MKKLYLTTYQYNTYLILDRLAEKIIKNGGCIVSDWEKTREPITIYNRTLTEHIDRLKNDIDIMSKNLATHTYTTDGKRNIIECRKKRKIKLKDLEKIKHGKIVHNKNYLNFKVDNYICYIEFNDNPFFTHYFTKKPIDEKTDDTYTTLYSYYLDDFSLDIFKKDDNANYDLYSYHISDIDIDNMVETLYQYCTEAKASEPVIINNRSYCSCCGHAYIKKEIQVKRCKYKEVKND